MVLVVCSGERYQVTATFSFLSGVVTYGSKTFKADIDPNAECFGRWLAMRKFANSSSVVLRINKRTIQSRSGPLKVKKKKIFFILFYAE